MLSLTTIQAGIAVGSTALCAHSYVHYNPWNTSTDLKHKYQPVIIATLLHLLLYFIFLFHQSCSGFVQKAVLTAKAKKEGEKPPSLTSIKYGKAGGIAILRADRAAGNMIEQSIPFLFALWMHAIFVDPVSAANLGFLWLAIRSFYPLVFGRGAFLFLVTVPNYMIIFGLVYPLI